MSFSNNEIILMNRRSGKSDDPFVSVSESIKVIGNKCLLAEIPNLKDKVAVSGSGVTWIETTSSTPTADQYTVDYDRGICTFHSSREGLTLTFSYKGKGFSSIYTDKIHTQYSGSTVTQNLTAKLSAMDTKDTSLQTQITDNETDIENKLQAHKDSITSHSAANITFTGSGMSSTNAQAGIKEAWDRAGNIIASSGTSSSETVDMRTLESGYVANRTITLAGDVLRDMQSRLKAAVNSPVTIKRGLNSVNAPEGGKLDVKVKGKTLVNLGGKDWNCDDTSKFTTWQSTQALDSTNQKYGTNAIKITIGTGYTYGSIDTLDFLPKLVAGRYYVILADVKNGNGTNMNVSFNAVGDTTNITSSVTTTTNYETKYIKIPPTYFDAATSAKFGIVVNGAATQYGYVDGIRLYEIDSATYNKIDVDVEYTGDKLAEKFPYVDSMKPLTTPYIEKKGKNLLPPFTEATIHTQSTVLEPYKLQTVATAAWAITTIKGIPIIAGQQYIFNVTHNGYLKIWYRDSAGNGISSAENFAVPYTFTPPTNTVSSDIEFANATAGTFTFTNPQLELGSVATTFAEYNADYAYAISDSQNRPLALCSNIDGTVADEINLSTGVKFKRFEYMDLDGSLTWTYDAFDTLAGYKTARSIISGSVSDNSYLSKYDGKSLKPTQVQITSSDYFRLEGDDDLFVTISNTDSGWIDSITPTADEMKAYFYGYKMCDAAGAAYVSGTKYWKKITDGTGITSTLPTASYTGYTPYKLQYQLATAVEEAVSVEGLINLHSGLNQVEMGEGIVTREVVTPWFDGTNNYIIGDTRNTTSYSKHPIKKAVSIYKNSLPDIYSQKASQPLSGGLGWSLGFVDALMQGSVKPILYKSDFDTTAIYTITYVLLSKYGYTSNAVDVTASVPSTQKAVLEAVVQQQADTATAVSVVQTQYARKNQSPYLAPVLLNGWLNYGGSLEDSGYLKNEFGFIAIKGTVKSGTSTSGTPIFILPVGYRPKKELIFAVISNNGTNDVIGRINVATNGEVRISSGSNTFLSLDGITFRAEQ